MLHVLKLELSISLEVNLFESFNLIRTKRFRNVSQTLLTSKKMFVQRSKKVPETFQGC